MVALTPVFSLWHLPQEPLGHRRPPLGDGRQKEDLLLNVWRQAQQVLSRLGELGLGLDCARRE